MLYITSIPLCRMQCNLVGDVCTHLPPLAPKPATNELHKSKQITSLVRLFIPNIHPLSDTPISFIDSNITDKLLYVHTKCAKEGYIYTLYVYYSCSRLISEVYSFFHIIFTLSTFQIFLPTNFFFLSSLCAMIIWSVGGQQLGLYLKIIYVKCISKRCLPSLLTNTSAFFLRTLARCN